jgi:hypothetical protein
LTTAATTRSDTASICASVKVASRGLERDLQRQAHLARRQLVAGEAVEQRHVGDQRPLGPPRRAQHRLGRHAPSTRKAKSRRTGWKAGRSAAPRLRRFGSGTASRNTSKPAAGPVSPTARQHARVDLAERAHRFGPLPHHAAAGPGW